MTRRCVRAREFDRSETRSRPPRAPDRPLQSAPPRRADLVHPSHPRSLPPLPQSEKSDDEDEGESDVEIIEEEEHAGTDEDEDEDEDEDVDVEDVLAELTLAAQKRLVEHAQKCVRQPLPR